MAKLLEKLNEGIIFHTINDDKKRVRDCLKGLKCLLQLAEKKSGKPLSTEQEIDILKKEIKNKIDIAEKYSYKEEYALEFRTEVGILSRHLPKYASIEETEIIVNKILSDNQLSTKKDFKKAVSLIMEGRSDIDKSIVSKLLQGKLI